MVSNLFALKYITFRHTFDQLCQHIVRLCNRHERFVEYDINVLEQHLLALQLLFVFANHHLSTTTKNYDFNVRQLLKQSVS